MTITDHKSRITNALAGAGFVFLVLAAVVAATGGFETAVGGVPISATSASRLFFEASVFLLIGTLVSPTQTRLLATLALFLIAAAADSEPRRVGDGFEYLGMARNLARLSPPSLSADDASALTREMAARGDTTWDGAVIATLRGADGRYDFPHFWLCSLAAAPLVAMATAIGAHPAYGFTVMNLALVLGVCWLLARAGAGPVAVLFAALMLWWIDKAHAEIFIAGLTAGALLLQAAAPGASLVMLGVVTAQMPALGVLLVACAAEALVRNGPRRPIVTAAVAAGVIAALHPLYYLWRLGVLSPLADTVIPHMPSVRAFVTPLADLNLGVVWFAPLLCVLAVAGGAAALRQRRSDSLPLAIGAAALMVAAAEATNVNHGGTPGMSRYGVWLLAMLLPLAARVNVAAQWRRACAAATALTVVFAAFALHPRLADAAITPTPTPLAAVVWTRVPWLDNPLPEVFAERVAHVDGIAPAPVAMPGGTKALIACDAPGALCYVNGDRVVPAPPQPGFSR